ncbi:6065_t:CDS:2 [Entrophospora sp. SA101]|nr:6065_t:CDS:2 [Entrophospora sp. SA101]CAJ0886060.1 494_t:CDS:2 [Entrophospora sp. SA101]
MLKREDVSEESKEGPVISVEEGRKVLENAKKSLEQEFATEKDVNNVNYQIALLYPTLVISHKNPKQKGGYKRGMTGLHNTKLYPLMHRDIRWPNIILHNEIYILIDFEFAEFAPQEALNQLKENEHAHEVLRGRHDEKVDLWNIGHLIFSSNTHNIPTDLSNLASKLYKDDSSR